MEWAQRGESMKFIARFVVVLICVVAIAHAQSSSQQNPVETFRSAVAGDATMLEIYLTNDPNPKRFDAAKKGKDDLSALTGPAIAAAGDNADLKSAIKALYVAADAYFESAFAFTGLPQYDPALNELVLSPGQVQAKATQARLKADVDSKNAALKLELQFGSN